MHDFIEKHRLIDRIQDSNINFLFGSGMSAGYLDILSNIEQLLTELNDDKTITDSNKKAFLRASILSKYFEVVIEKNPNILDESTIDSDLISTLNSYKTFFKTINQLILLRRNKLLSKQVNIFTTNIDIFLERGIEEVGLEGNDGFCKGFKPKYDLSNFKKSIFQKSLHFDNSSEIPVFNILKIHGSLTWKHEKASIYFDSSLEQIQKVKTTSKSDLIDVLTKDTTIAKKDDLKSLIAKLPKTVDETKFITFLEEYDKLSIVNPTKGKFQQTVLDQKYYDLLRIYANELERENTLLFVMGFSFADEHIRDLTIRVANSNPTLMIYILAHTTQAKEDLEKTLDIKKNVKNKNIFIVAPTQSEQENKSFKDDFSYSFDEINERIFKKTLENISKPLSKKIFKATLEGFGNE